MNIEEYILSGIIEAYVLGMADADEVAQLEQLKKQHPEIQAAIDSFENELEATAMANAVTPAATTKTKLMQALAEDFSNLDTNTTESSTQPTAPKEAKVVQLPLTPIASKAGNLFKYIAAASIILLLGSTATNVYLFNKYNTLNKEVIALLNDKNTLTTDNNTIQTKYQEVTNSLQLMSDTNIIKVALKGIAGKEGNLATVFWNNKTKDVYLLSNKLPKAPEGKQYQLWALVNGKPIDAGMLQDCNGVCKLKNTVKADVFAITLEKAGGSPSPDLTQLYVLGKVSS